MNIEDEIKEMTLEIEYLQRDKDKLFHEFQNRYSELEYTIRNLEKNIRVKKELLNNGVYENDQKRNAE